MESGERSVLVFLLFILLCAGYSVKLFFIFYYSTKLKYTLFYREPFTCIDLAESIIYNLFLVSFQFFVLILTFFGLALLHYVEYKNDNSLFVEDFFI